ncbi:MAG TPA: DNA repair protein RecN [Alphaproteobacteria bacterium]|nr:DNA repair protein RecN [Rhodospirillaceae bacterium]HRJ12509.1 DNA repair protein RecN [Alphaproteobacteria bacterium]
MLTHLSIRDVVLITSLDLELESGLTVLTGETGAGKSIILDALSLVLGARSDARLVRSGAKQASVTASFDLPPDHPAFAALGENGIDAKDELIIRRVVNADGKSKAFVNDQPVGVTLLKEISPLLVDVHGQFDNHGLMDPATHRELLDRFAGHEKLLAAARDAYDDRQEKILALENLRAVAAKAQADEAFLRASVQELDDLSPEVGEEQKLAARRQFLQQQEKLFEVLRASDDRLQSVENSVSDIRRQVDKLMDKAGDALAPLSATLNTLYDAIAHAQQETENVARQLNNDDQSLEQSEARLFALRALARKHHCTADELPEKRKEFTQALLLIEDQGDFMVRLEKETHAAREQYVAAAEKLSISRNAAGEKLARAIHKELAPLKLEKANFKIALDAVSESAWSANGIDQIRFMVATNPGQPHAPLHKTASGGEMARLLLAIKVVLAKIENIPVLVFDEVDTGIGGAVAEAVGERLEKLSKDAQVIVITHAAQVAARGAHHLQVSKSQKAKQTETSVVVLAGKERREEIARMISGAEISNEARAVADKLLAG